MSCQICSDVWGINQDHGELRVCALDTCSNNPFKITDNDNMLMFYYSYILQIHVMEKETKAHLVLNRLYLTLPPSGVALYLNWWASIIEAKYEPAAQRRHTTDRPQRCEILSNTSYKLTARELYSWRVYLSAF